MDNDTHYVRGTLNGREVNLPDPLSRDYLVCFFGVSPEATITVYIPGARPGETTCASLNGEELSIRPGTVVNAVVINGA